MFSLSPWWLSWVTKYWGLILMIIFSVPCHWPSLEPHAFFFKLWNWNSFLTILYFICRINTHSLYMYIEFEKCWKWIKNLITGTETQVIFGVFPSDLSLWSSINIYLECLKLKSYYTNGFISLFTCHDNFLTALQILQKHVFEKWHRLFTSLLEI